MLLQERPGIRSVKTNFSDRLWNSRYLHCIDTRYHHHDKVVLRCSLREPLCDSYSSLRSVLLPGFCDFNLSILGQIFLSILIKVLAVQASSTFFVSEDEVFFVNIFRC